MGNIVSVTPDKEKAKSILKMVEKTLQMIRTIDAAAFTSNVVKEYYEVIRELLSILLLLDGKRTMGDQAHKLLIEHASLNFGFLDQESVMLIDGLRIIRNKVAYDGFFVKAEYLQRNKKAIEELIALLHKEAEDRLG
ncbi:MAG: hypothetical protein GXP63_02020 [DPANN group archaeon]|nr:hypothetical protein [DPANN group archaeon]